MLGNSHLGIRAMPDVYRTTRGREFFYLGPKWVSEALPQMVSLARLPSERRPAFIRLDLSNVEAIRLFDWVQVVGALDALADLPEVRQIDLDVVGGGDKRLAPYDELSRMKRSRGTTDYTDDELRFSSLRYRLLGFIESLGSREALGHGPSAPKIILPHVPEKAAVWRHLYSGDERSPKVVLGLTSIRTPDDVRSFLRSELLSAWRSSMDERFQKSTLFLEEELWRVFCFELASNVVQHASSNGHIAARVIEQTRLSTGALSPLCRWSFGTEFHPFLRSVKGPVLELVISDLGQGVVETLRSVAAAKYSELGRGLREFRGRQPLAQDVLAFAFDELGTSKIGTESIAIRRHALTRLLSLVRKYEGALYLRSGGQAIGFLPNRDMVRRPFRLGFEPHFADNRTGVGTQFHVLLPLSVDQPKSKLRRRSILDESLPSGFRSDPQQVRGHLIPLSESVPRQPVVSLEEEVKFQTACEALCRGLLESRPNLEPIVIDCSGLQWSEGQMERFTYYLQNVLQARPCLLVELDGQFLERLVKLHQSGAPTTLGRFLKEWHRREGEQISEERFFETFGRIHLPLMALDLNGRVYFLGVSDEKVEEVLVALLERPMSMVEIASAFPTVKQEVLLATLAADASPFELLRGRWRCIWGTGAIKAEATRVVVRHFKDVADRSRAWRGGFEEEKGSAYFLPWVKQWRAEFLQTSRIFERGRHLDEIAQRLVYRARVGMGLVGRAFDEVVGLAATTAPAMLLAGAMRRWWGGLNAPAVFDLGHYIHSASNRGIPDLPSPGSWLVLQDVVDSGDSTRQLMCDLRESGADVLAALSFVRFLASDDPLVINQDDHHAASVADHGDGWDHPEPIHSLLYVARPRLCPNPQRLRPERQFWVFPRALRPARLPTLRREFQVDRDPDLAWQEECLERFDRGSDGCLFKAGHFTYGRRHSIVNIDASTALLGEIGAELAEWLAGICEGRTDRWLPPWESEAGTTLRGDVAAVLMPLHSQIHVLWPRVEALMARRGRRQPNWQLESALFEEGRPTYRLPLQFRRQIDYRLGRFEARGYDQVSEDPLRILIVDDTVATGRTAITVLGEIIRYIRHQRAATGGGSDRRSPIEWVRYITFLGQTAPASHMLRHSLRGLSDPDFTVVFDEFAPFMDVGLFDDDDCPACADRRRIDRLYDTCRALGAEGAAEWLVQRSEELRPAPLEIGPTEARPAKISLARTLDVTAAESHLPGRERVKFRHVDSAIFRFHQLMKVPCPLPGIINSLRAAWPKDGESGLVGEYERYRWAVLEWCLRHWQRVKEDGAELDWYSAAAEEVARETGLLEPIMEYAGRRLDVAVMRQLVFLCVKRLVGFEGGVKAASPSHSMWAGSVLRLVTALQMCLLNVEGVVRQRLPGAEVVLPEEIEELLGHLHEASRLAKGPGVTHLELLYSLFEMRVRPPDPRRSLEVVVQNLFRGRTASGSLAGNHHLLPWLARAYRDEEFRTEESATRLRMSLMLFLSALEEVLPYLGLSAARSELASFLSSSEIVLEGLSCPPDAPPSGFDRARREIDDILHGETGHEELVQLIRNHFHRSTREIFDALVEGARQHERLALVALYGEYGSLPLLVPVQAIELALANRLIDPVARVDGNYMSSINVAGVEERASTKVIVLRLVTAFASLEETRRQFGEGHNHLAEERELGRFGVEFSSWAQPTEDERRLGGLAATEIKLPIGFEPKEKADGP